MAKVRYPVEGKEIDVPVGTSLLEASGKAHVPHGSACGGVCACSTCHVYVNKGAQLLSEAEDDEQDILDKAFDVRATSRLGCQAIIQQDGEDRGGAFARVGGHVLQRTPGGAARAGGGAEGRRGVEIRRRRPRNQGNPCWHHVLVEGQNLRFRRRSASALHGSPFALHRIPFRPSRILYRAANPLSLFTDPVPPYNSATLQRFIDVADLPT